MNGSRAEAGWRWLCRGLAVVGFVFLLAVVGLDRAPWGAYMLLIGLFFGPEVISGQLKINQQQQPPQPPAQPPAPPQEAPDDSGGKK